VVVAIALAAGARADEESPEKAQARVLLSQGNALFERGDLRGALADFRAAYALYPSPKLLINAAAAERELGDAAGAATDLRHFLDDATDEEGALIDRARADLRGLERKVTRVGLRGWPARSTLEVDGRAVRDPSYVRPGTHSLRARAPMGLEVTKELEATAGESFELPAPRGALVGSDDDGAGAGPTAVAGARRDKPRWAAWKTGLIVAGGVLLIGGAVTAAVLATKVGQARAVAGDLGTIPFSDFH
jgi:hypothetical protein